MVIISASQFQIILGKPVVGTFNQVKALVGAFSVFVKLFNLCFKL